MDMERVEGTRANPPSRHCTHTHTRPTSILQVSPAARFGVPCAAARRPSNVGFSNMRQVWSASTAFKLNAVDTQRIAQSSRQGDIAPAVPTQAYI